MNACIIGETKTGKTYSLNTLPGKTVHLSFDPNGYSALRREHLLVQPGNLADHLDKADFLVIDYCSLMAQELTLTMDRGARSRAGEAAYRAFVADVNTALSANTVDNLVCDGLTGLGDVVLNAVLSLNQRKKPQFEDWGQAIDKLTEIVGVCSAGKPNFILLCHVQVERDEVTGRVKETPLVYGKQLPNKLMALFDNVFATGFSGSFYYWITKPQPLMPTIGSRQFDNLPERIHQNFAELFVGQARSIATK